MAKIEYVGLKDQKTDNVAGTETVWNGTGDVQEVDDAVAAKLIAHPNIWRLAKGERAKIAPATAKDVDPQVAKAEKLAKLKKDEAEETELARVARRVDINALPKDKLIAYAKRTFGLDLDAKKDEKLLRAAVQRAEGKIATGRRHQK